MKKLLVEAYQGQLVQMFQDVQADFGKKSFGLKAAIVEKTIPLMLLEGRRETGKDDLPLLSEAVKNVIFATSLLMFGWDKACALHLRVALENIMNGVHIFNNSALKKRFNDGEEIQYCKMSQLVPSFVAISTKSELINTQFNLNQLITDTYSSLSKWSHTLGSGFCTTLPNLGFQDLKRKRVGEINKVYDDLIRISVLVYLTSSPYILNDFGKSEQRKLLGPLSLPERKFLRETLAI